jgi:hypothetical protein
VIRDNIMLVLAVGAYGAFFSPTTARNRLTTPNISATILKLSTRLADKRCDHD